MMGDETAKTREPMMRDDLTPGSRAFLLACERMVSQGNGVTEILAPLYNMIEQGEVESRVLAGRPQLGR